MFLKTNQKRNARSGHRTQYVLQSQHSIRSYLHVTQLAMNKPTRVCLRRSVNVKSYNFIFVDIQDDLWRELNMAVIVNQDNILHLKCT